MSASCQCPAPIRASSAVASAPSSVHRPNQRRLRPRRSARAPSQGADEHHQEAGAGVGDPEIEGRGCPGQVGSPVLVEKNRKQTDHDRGDEGVVGPCRQRPGPLRGTSRCHSRPSCPQPIRPLNRPGARASGERRCPASVPVMSWRFTREVRQEHELAIVIERELIVRPRSKFLELARLRRRHPARRIDRDVVEHALHTVLVLQPESDHLELQLPDRAEDQIAVAQRPEQLRRALFAQLIESLGRAPSFAADP